MVNARLIKTILELSVSQTWETAKLEWELSNLHISNGSATCPCGHCLKRELCEISNLKNGNIAIIGYTCLEDLVDEKFISSIENSIKRVKKIKSTNLNKKIIEFARIKLWITKWEYNIYIGIMRHRHLSKDQLKIKIDINKVVLDKFNAFSLKS